jgi:hypothetical protein
MFELFLEISFRYFLRIFINYSHKKFYNIGPRPKKVTTKKKSVSKKKIANNNKRDSNKAGRAAGARGAGRAGVEARADAAATEIEIKEEFEEFDWNDYLSSFNKQINDLIQPVAPKDRQVSI